MGHRKSSNAICGKKRVKLVAVIVLEGGRGCLSEEVMFKLRPEWPHGDPMSGDGALGRGDVRCKSQRTLSK